MCILVKAPCKCITGNITREHGQEPIKYEARPGALFSNDHSPSATFPAARTVLTYGTACLTSAAFRNTFPAASATFPAARTVPTYGTACLTSAAFRNITRGHGQEPKKHEVQPGALFSNDHAPSATFPAIHEQERYFNWFIVAACLTSAAFNNLKWALRSKLPNNDARKEPWQDW